jgi:hypothetical protein
MIDQPCAEYHSDSARVENRCPSIMTRVPEPAGTQPKDRDAAIAVDRPLGQ